MNQVTFQIAASAKTVSISKMSMGTGQDVYLTVYLKQLISIK